MRVILVAPFTNINAECKNAPRPEVGDIDEVTKELQDHREVVYYNLRRFGDYYAYQADLFAILPDAEPSTVTEEETQLATA